LKTTRRDVLKGLLATAGAVVLRATGQKPDSTTTTTTVHSTTTRSTGSGLDGTADAQSTGRMMLVEFDRWAEARGIAPGKRAAFRDQLAEQYGLRRKQWAGWSRELADDAVVHLDRYLRLDNFGITSPEVRERTDFLWATQGAAYCGDAVLEVQPGGEIDLVGYQPLRIEWDSET